MSALSQSHARMGFRNWTLTRSIDHAEEWRLQFMVKTWADYMNYRTRMTIADRRVVEILHNMHGGPNSLPVFISLAVRPAAKASGYTQS